MDFIVSCVRLGIHLQHLSTTPTFVAAARADKPPVWRGTEAVTDDRYYEPVQWRMLARVCTAPVKYDPRWCAGDRRRRPPPASSPARSSTSWRTTPPTTCSTSGCSTPSSPATPSCSPSGRAARRGRRRGGRRVSCPYPSRGRRRHPVAPPRREAGRSRAPRRWASPTSTPACSPAGRRCPSARRSCSSSWTRRR